MTNFGPLIIDPEAHLISRSLEGRGFYVLQPDIEDVVRQPRDDNTLDLSRLPPGSIIVLPRLEFRTLSAPELDVVTSCCHFQDAGARGLFAKQSFIVRFGSFEDIICDNYNRDAPLADQESELRVKRSARIRNLRTATLSGHRQDEAGRIRRAQIVCQVMDVLHADHCLIQYVRSGIEPVQTAVEMTQIGFLNF